MAQVISNVDNKGLQNLEATAYLAVIREITLTRCEK